MAENVVTVLAAAGALMPVDANAAALPLPTAVPVHVALLYRLTVDPASAVPLTNGALDMPGEPGTVLITDGGPAGTVSMVTDSDPTDSISCVPPPGAGAVSSAVILCVPSLSPMDVIE